ncbi:hypothetical protein ISO64_01660 [Morganella morganii subsp. morganii]|uniref:hypothetical protein n=2 Tax=Morganella morganii TaxID=582 RepID=UPI001BD9688B|nr:hypothetical protein [Morganella morganii]MBT0394731.1 hypothetical protein [Morganella morganii subsp. morganii]MBT0459892.1 hypothetical protein [Morganella morganii subsp. morganii]MDR5684863.1 hypothetical protein [Morganella morganii]
MPESLFNIMKKHCISRFSAGEEPTSLLRLHQMNPRAELNSVAVQWLIATEITGSAHRVGGVCITPQQPYWCTGENLTPVLTSATLRRT